MHLSKIGNIGDLIVISVHKIDSLFHVQADFSRSSLMKAAVIHTIKQSFFFWGGKLTNQKLIIKQIKSLNSDWLGNDGPH